MNHHCNTLGGMDMDDPCHILEGIDLDKEINFMMCGVTCPPLNQQLWWHTQYCCRLYPEDLAEVSCEGCLSEFGLRLLSELP